MCFHSFFCFSLPHSLYLSAAVHHTPLASTSRTSPASLSTMQPARDKSRDLKSPDEPSDARWLLRSLDDFPRIQELSVCGHATPASHRSQEKTQKHIRMSADGQTTRSSSPSTHHKTDVPRSPLKDADASL